MSDVMSVIRQSLIDLGIPAHEITSQARVQGDLRLDSTEAVQVSLDLKKAFDLSIKIDFSTDPMLTDLVRLVELQLVVKTA